MPPDSKGRGRVILVLGALAVVGGAVLLLLRLVEPKPLVQGGRAVVTFPASQDDVLSWGVAIPRNETHTTIVLLEAEPLGVSGVEMLGDASFDPDRLSIGLLRGYPPEGYSLAEVEGTRVPAGETRHLVFGVQLADGAASGAICGVRVTYDHEGRRHELVLDHQLHLVPPAETQSPAPSLDSGACPSS